MAEKESRLGCVVLTEGQKLIDLLGTNQRIDGFVPDFLEDDVNLLSYTCIQVRSQSSLPYVKLRLVHAASVLSRMLRPAPVKCLLIDGKSPDEVSLKFVCPLPKQHQAVQRRPKVEFCKLSQRSTYHLLFE